MATAVGSTIGALRVVIGADTTGLQRGLRDAGNRTADFKKQALVAAAAIAAIGTAAAAAGAKLVGMAREEMNVIDAQAKLARSLDGTVTGLRALNHAANLSGVDGLESSLARLNRRLGATEMGVGPAADTVKRLGLNLKELASLDVDAKVAHIADAIRDSGVSSQEAARHLQNLGFQQHGVTELFMQGGDAIRAARGEIEDFGLSVSQVDAAKIEAANDAFTRLGLVTQGLKTQLAIALAPALLETGQRLAMVAENFLKVATATGKADDKITDLSKSPFVTRFVQPTIMGLARLMDVLTALARLMSAIKGSFEVVGNDLLALAAKARTAAQWMNPVNIFDPEALESAIDNEKAVLAKRTQVLKDANQAWHDAWNIPANQYEQAAMAAFSAPLPDVTVPSGGGGGGGFDFGGVGVGDGTSGGGAAAKENDQLQQRLENLRVFLATREDLEVQAGIDRVNLIGEALDAGLISEQEHNQMLYDVAGKFYNSMAALRDEKYQEQRDKLQELNELDIISDAEYHARKLELLAQQEQEKTDALIEAFLLRKEMLDEMVAEGEISDEEHRQRQIALEQEMQDELTLITARAASQRAKLAQNEASQRRQITQNMMNNLVQLMNSGSKQMFAIGKVAAVANALLKGREAVVSAYAAGSKIGGPPLGAAYAATAAAATAAQVASVMSTTFGGGGTVSANGGGGTTGRVTDSISNDPLPEADAPKHSKVTINLTGEIFNRQQVRDLIEQINEATADGATLRLN